MPYLKFCSRCLETRHLAGIKQAIQEVGAVVEAELIALGARSAADPVCFLELETDGIPVEKVLAIKERLMEAAPVQDPQTLLFEFGPLSDMSTNALAESALSDIEGLPFELDEPPAGLPPTPITI